MSSRIEDYAVIGNCQSMALVRLDGSIDWLCAPRFDSEACFAALLGDPSHGHWRISPNASVVKIERRYRGDTMVLETVFETETGTVSVTDAMTHRAGEASDLVRIVRGLRGTVAMRSELVVRFGYGAILPWASKQDDGRIAFTAGPDRLVLDSPVEPRGEDMRTLCDFDLAEGEEVGFTLTWTPSFEPLPDRLDPSAILNAAERFWSDWAGAFTDEGEWSDVVLRSLITLKGLAHWRTGGIVAAATTSLPEQLGGSRNWDYRFCWLRDSTFTLFALIGAGFLAEAKAWRDWLLRAVAGDPDDLQIMYGVAGERRLSEYELPHLPGYEGAAPVRIGNAAAGQLQLDVYGEVLASLYVARKAGLAWEAAGWGLECALIERLETLWHQPDDGIWEVRGGRRHFTHSKVMAWVAFDRAIRSAEEFGLDGPVEHWREVRDAIHAEVCARGFDTARNTFVQSYGASALDASLLLIPMVGFLPPTDPRIRGTVAAIEKELLRDGLVARYDTGEVQDGLPPGEGAFLACSFWLADNYVLQGRMAEARALFERLIGLRNDVGLLSEEYDVRAMRQVGNFPQAFSHLSLINAARNLSSAAGSDKETSSNIAGGASEAQE